MAFQMEQYWTGFEFSVVLVGTLIQPNAFPTIAHVRLVLLSSEHIRLSVPRNSNR